MPQPKITIFTPTYNRLYTLGALYESLCGQSYKDFEWLVIDDGSTDGTCAKIAEWSREGKIAIKYHFKENGGKMSAHNFALTKAEGEWFMCVDSDDSLCGSDVLQNMIEFWENTIKSELPKGVKVENLCGILSYIHTYIHKQVNIKEHNLQFPLNVKVSSFSELYKNGFNGELALLIKTDIIKLYPYPYFEGENFITDDFVFEQIEEKYKMLLLPMFSQYRNYQNDGYSYNYRKLLLTNPLGYRAFNNQRVGLKKFNHTKNVINYIALCLRIKDGTMLSGSANKLLTILLFPLGVAKYFYDKRFLKTL